MTVIHMCRFPTCCCASVYSLLEYGTQLIQVFAKLRHFDLNNSINSSIRILIASSLDSSFESPLLVPMLVVSPFLSASLFTSTGTFIGCLIESTDSFLTS